MRYQKLGHTGLFVSELCLGTMTFGGEGGLWGKVGQLRQAEAEQLVSVVVEKSAKHAKSAVSCQSLMLDSESRSDTIPAMDIRTRDAAIGHEAKIGSISNDAVFYLMSRGMSEEDARALIVSGFADNVSKELPVEYAVEMNNLIRLEMKGSIG